MATTLTKPIAANQNLTGHTTWFQTAASTLKRHCGPFVTAVCLMIGLVSAYDAYLTMAYSPFLVHLESNPIGRRIMELDEGRLLNLQRVAFFLGLKFAGTICAISIIHLLYFISRRIAVPVACAVGLLQLALLCYLKFANG